MFYSQQSSSHCSGCDWATVTRVSEQSGLKLSGVRQLPFPFKFFTRSDLFTLKVVTPFNNFSFEINLINLTVKFFNNIIMSIFTKFRVNQKYLGMYDLIINTCLYFKMYISHKI